MKKLLVLILVIGIVFALAGCKSEEQKAAAEYIAEFERLVEEYRVVAEEKDFDKALEISDKIGEHIEKGSGIEEALREKDEEAADEYGDELERLLQEELDIMTQLYGFDFDFDIDLT